MEHSHIHSFPCGLWLSQHHSGRAELLQQRQYGPQKSKMFTVSSLLEKMFADSGSGRWAGILPRPILLVVELQRILSLARLHSQDTGEPWLKASPLTSDTACLNETPHCLQPTAPSQIWIYRKPQNFPGVSEMRPVKR